MALWGISHSRDPAWPSKGGGFVGRRSRKRLIIGGLALLVVILVCVWFFVDAPPPDDADLRITYEDIPEGENAFTYFRLAVEKLAWPTDPAQGRLLHELVSHDEWDEAVVTSALEDNHDVLALTEQGLSCARHRLPEIKTYDDELALIPTTARWSCVSELGGARAKLLFLRGRQDDAFAQALQMVRFCHVVEGGGCSASLWRCASWDKQRELAQIRRMLADTSLGPERLRWYAQALESYRVNEQGFADALRTEYRCLIALIDAPAAPGPMDDWIGGSDTPFHLRFLRFKPNKTKRLVASGIRTMIAGISKPFGEAKLPRVPQPFGVRYEVRIVLSDNGEGLLTYHFLMGTLLRVYHVKCQENCAVEATRIQIALRCYQLEHGELPETLDELVPEYFESVPLDDFDGKPMKYSKEKRVVYAVGTDLTDNGGIGQERRGSLPPDDGYDLVHKIAF